MVFKIETRKVQKTGGSSYIISLPRAWIEKHKIKPKDTLGILSQPDGNLLVSPNINSEDFIKSKDFDVDNISDSNYLFRILIGMYIMGYTVITIKSSKKFEPFIRDTITNFTKIAIGPEIIEESNNIIKIKDLLNPKEMPFEKTIRRMYILAQDMHENAIKALNSGDKTLAEEVIKRDDEVDRLHWLIGRQSHIVLRDIILCQKMGITLEDTSHFQSISRFLERIADHSVKIAKNVLLIDFQKIDKKILTDLSKASIFALKMLDISLDAWLNKSINLANENINSVKELIDTCENIYFKLDKIAEFSVPIGYVIESIRRTGEYSVDISEVIINKLI
ncbi:MAG: phosphate uptake regulator PhoU [Promethearchaeota archaeon]|nr:MAG: phosphate uptake regulator PhoU [Candidatus Lokiarchaeota archaeon]